MEHPPLIRTDLPEIDGERALTFVELVELLYVRAFQQAGASWATIKEAASVAGRIYSSAHPFALRHVYVDGGKRLWAEVKEQDGAEGFVQLKGHAQHGFPALVKPYLDQLEFDMNDVANRWWPLGRKGGILVDPLYSFGAPIVEGTNIRAKTLTDMFDAEEAAYGERTVERVAWIYEVSATQVENALHFRSWLRKAA